MGYIPKDALEGLRSYKYKGVDKSVASFCHSLVSAIDAFCRSILSRYVLNPYWNQLVKLWPKSVAPNTVCLISLKPKVE